MKKFLIKFGVLLIPVIIYIFIALLIDPYNIVNEERNSKLIEIKKNTSLKFNYPLYKLQEYSRNPTDVIILGDSRSNRLSTSLMDSLTEMKTANLSYGGGTIPEIIDTFWYVTEINNIKEIYIGINFNLFNQYNNMNRVNEAIKLIETPHSSLFSRYTLKSLFYIIKSRITNKTMNIEKPKFTESEFWKYQLESTASNFYRNYKYPNSFQSGLAEISDYCKKESIKLIFFIPPTHIDLQHKVSDFNLLEEEIKFKTELKNLGVIYDFDYSSQITRNRNNFSDPFHFNDSIAEIVITEIVTSKREFALTY